MQQWSAKVLLYCRWRLIQGLARHPQENSFIPSGLIIFNHFTFNQNRTHSVEIIQIIIKTMATGNYKDRRIHADHPQRYQKKTRIFWLPKMFGSFKICPWQGIHFHIVLYSNIIQRRHFNFSAWPFILIIIYIYNFFIFDTGIV